MHHAGSFCEWHFEYLALILMDIHAQTKYDFKPQEDAMLTYQICFDLLENEMQAFLLKASAPPLKNFRHI